jgi:magnesium-transporting ATPase (P-type)
MRRRAKLVAKTAKNMRNKNHRVALVRIIASLRRINLFYLLLFRLAFCTGFPVYGEGEFPMPVLWIVVAVALDTALAPEEVPAVTEWGSAGFEVPSAVRAFERVCVGFGAGF